MICGVLGVSWHRFLRGKQSSEGKTVNFKVLWDSKMFIAQHQLELIFRLIGSPNQEEIDNIENERWREYTRKAKKCKGKDFDKMFAGSNPLAVDLLKKLLVFDPRKRITVEGALKHEYLKGLHIEEDEPTRGPINPLEFEFEKHKLNGEQLKGIFYLVLHFISTFRSNL